MKILVDLLSSHEKTTLNRMRDKPDAFKILNLLPFISRTHGIKTQKKPQIDCFAVATIPRRY